MGKKIIVISGPSGVGKTTLYRQILKRYDEHLGFSISATTRPIRPGEEDGADYYFISPQDFDHLIEGQKFIEFETNYGNRYGTLKSEIERIWGEGKHCFLDLDIKGALNIKKLFPNDAVLIFVAPPSLDALMQRLYDRGADENITERLRDAENEMAHSHRYHYTVVNAEVAKATEDLDRILRKII